MRVREEPYDPNCFLAAAGVYEGGGMPPCDGRLVRAHFISKQVLYRELGRDTPPAVIWDPRVWRWACGGVTGCSGHHGAFDSTRRLTLPRAALPASVWEFAAAYQLEWWVDQAYPAYPEVADA